MANYIKEIRSLTGHRPLILNSSTGCLLNDQQQILLQERADTGGWCLPGGYLEFGESYKEAIVREFKEDTGLSFTVNQTLGVFDKYFYTYPNGDETQIISTLFVVKKAGGRLLNQVTNETTAVRFFDLDSAPALFFKQSQDMLDCLKQWIAKQ